MNEFGPDDFMSIAIIEAFNEKLAGAAALLKDALGVDAGIAAPDVSQGVYAIPFASYVNRIENALVKLTAGGFYPAGMIPPTVWKGELEDERFLDFNDVNRWFDSLRQIEDLIRAAKARALITGNYFTGGDRTRQVLRGSL
jgi:hypothetical protein